MIDGHVPCGSTPSSASSSAFAGILYEMTESHKKQLFFYRYLNSVVAGILI